MSEFAWEVLLFRGCGDDVDTRFVHHSGEVEVAIQPYRGGVTDGSRYVVEVFETAEGPPTTARTLGTTDDRSTGLAMAIEGIIDIERTGGDVTDNW
mgnify:CR=1 FL=1